MDKKEYLDQAERVLSQWRARSETRSETRSEARSEVRSEARSEVRSEARSEARSEDKLFCTDCGEEHKLFCTDCGEEHLEVKYFHANTADERQIVPKDAPQYYLTFHRKSKEKQVWECLLEAPGDARYVPELMYWGDPADKKRFSEYTLMVLSGYHRDKNTPMPDGNIAVNISFRGEAHGEYIGE